MIQHRDLKHVLELAKLEVASYDVVTDETRAAVWAIEREVVVGNAPDLDVYWLMGSEPKAGA